MWPSPKILQSPAQFLHLPTTPALAPTPIQPIPTSPFPPTVRQQCPYQFSRRELTFFSNSSLLLLLGSQALDPFHLPRSLAEEIATQEEDSKANITAAPSCTEKTPTKRAFLDISINGEPIGRIVIGLYSEIAPAGATRFSNLVSGAAGISYRRKEFIKIMPNYVQHGGVRSYGVDAEMANSRAGYLVADRLMSEWERLNEGCSGTKNLAGSIGIIVRDPSKPPPKVKLVARNGKLEIDEEEIRPDPNGTEFVIATEDSPELDSSVLVVGRILEGMEVAKRIGEVKTVNENTGSPYFRVAKLIGDKRAVVAERGFNRPYSKVIVSNCGLLE